MSTETRITLTDFIREHKITMRIERTDRNPHMDDSRDMDHWRVTLRANGRRMSLVFSKGYGHHGAEPTVSEVLSCLADDAAGALNTDFEEWCSELGYDTDSRRADKTWRAVSRQAQSLARLFEPDALSTLLYNTERE